MKKRIGIPLILILIFTLAACGSLISGNDLPTAEEKHLTAETVNEETNLPKDADPVISAEPEYPNLIRISGALYYDTGEISTALRCGMLDGRIDSISEGRIPTEDNQSNFGTGYGYQIGSNRYEVNIDGQWHIFRPYAESESAAPE